MARTDGQEPRAWFGAEGLPDLVVSRTEGAVTVVAPGHRPVSVELSEGDRDLRLEAGLPIRLVLPEDLALPEPPYHLGVELVPVDGPAAGGDRPWGDGYLRRAGGDRPWSAGDPLLFEPGVRELSLLVHGPGRYEVRWWVRRIAWTDEGPRAGRSIFGAHHRDARLSIEVADTPEEQIFPLPVDPEGLRRTRGESGR
jgi:hypothetical protein